MDGEGRVGILDYYSGADFLYEYEVLCNTTKVAFMYENISVCFPRSKTLESLF